MMWFQCASLMCVVCVVDVCVVLLGGAAILSFELTLNSVNKINCDNTDQF